MKKIIILIACLGYMLSSYSQALKTRSDATFTQLDQRLAAGLNFSIPYGATPTLNGGLARPGSLFYNTTDSLLYVYKGTMWAVVSSSVDLSNYYTKSQIDSLGAGYAQLSGNNNFSGVNNFSGYAYFDGGGSYTQLLLTEAGLNSFADITTSTNISAIGTITGSNLSGNNTGDQDLSNYLKLNSGGPTQIVTNAVTFEDDISANYITAAGLVSIGDDLYTNLNTPITTATSNYDILTRDITSGQVKKIASSSLGPGTVTSVSVTTANGVSGTVATSTTTPAITLSLGAITPTSTNGVSAATMAYNDATSSIQTQLNAKQSAVIGTITPVNTAIATSDNVTDAFSKTQGQINNLSSITNVKTPLGVRFTDDFARGSLGSSYTQTGSSVTWAPDGSKLIVSGLTSSLTVTDYITRNDYRTDADELTLEATIKVTHAPASTTYGIGFRIESGTNASSNGFYQFRVDCTNSASNNGRLYVGVNNTGGTQFSTGRAVLIQNDILTVRLVIVRNIVTAYVLNQRTGQTTIQKSIYSFISPNGQALVNHIRFGLLSFGGNYEVSNFKLTSNTVVGPDYLFIGDSITEGLYTGSTDDRFPNLVGSYDRTKVTSVYAKGGIISQDIVDDLSEIVAIAPKTVFLMVGFNDSGAGVSQATTISNLTTIKTTLEAAGIVVIFLSVPTKTALNTATIAAFPSNRYIDVFTPISQQNNAAAYDALYTADGGIHPNKLGAELMARTIYASARDLFPINLPNVVFDGKWSSFGDTFGNTVTFGTRDAFGVNFLANSIAAGKLSSVGAWRLGDNTDAVASSMLQIVSTTKGFLKPVMTSTQRDAIASPATGLEVFNSTLGNTNFYGGSAWKRNISTNDATPSNGQIPIGNGTDYTVAALTAGSGISVTNGSGSITVATTTLSGSATLDFSNLAPNIGEIKTINVPGAAVGDAAALGFVDIPYGNSTFQVWVSATDTVSVIFQNHDPSVSVDPASAVFKVKVFK